MTVQIVRWEDLPEIPRVDTKWLDERELCPLVQRYAHGGAWARAEERTQCDDYCIAYCHRAGGRNLVNCAFDDRDFDWRKALDWQRLDAGGYLYDPQPKRTNGNGKH